MGASFIQKENHLFSDITQVLAATFENAAQPQKTLILVPDDTL